MSFTLTEPTYERYRAITNQNIHKYSEWERLDPELKEAVMVVSQVLPFRTNEYVMRELIDWSRVPEDPIFQLTFPQREMLDPEDYERIRTLLNNGASREELLAAANEIRFRLNPHPAGQLTHNVPTLNGRKLPGLQHKYHETVLFFPGQGQTCHAYCTYCFRWAQFIGLQDIKFEARETDDLVAYLQAHPEVTDVLVTGGDPMIMRTKILRKYLEPLLEIPTLRTIRIGTKSLAYWPQRYVTDADADDALRFFEEIVAAGKHLAIMAHSSHPVELATPIAQEAIRRVRETGAVIRTQAPLIKHVNDDPDVWAEKWRQEVKLGMIPYYMFVERDTGPKRYFEVPLARAQEIFAAAWRQVSGLARTVRGPSMSAFPGKVRIIGTAEVAGEKVFVLEFLQGRNPEWVGKPFFAKFDPHASWLDDLKPAFGQERFFYEEELARMAH
ncbi:KamA family radical SAM protein [Marinithermus hydrothermalis]|uniref:L-lysine 2,3-aminomutase n=1 Tax=Marinithermus hydrothermalis (strain DSM 14884 / JCM 11576 / T1) TaxID=869210 RepID=F2NQ30_MARHT|nr:lysine 2,3-aminomutase [Marinithermus hydrothermalis]AEB11131.1 L-lysine 2,3-aminomutase [Marinithermus hydrothermalis DSM 14884]